MTTFEARWKKMQALVRIFYKKIRDLFGISLFGFVIFAFAAIGIVVAINDQL